MSDINLKNLSEASPPPNNRKNNKSGKRNGKKKKPNQNRNTRISARRIGGVDYTADMEKMKQQRLKQAAGKKQKSMTSQSTGKMTAVVPVAIGSNHTRSKPRNSGLNGTMPRVQELGGLGRRSSSRLRVGSGRIAHQKSRKSSNASSHSQTQVEGAGYFTQKEAIIRYGDLLKKGVVTTAWKKRFFVLSEGHLLYYLESFDVPQELHQIEIAPKGQIDLSLVEDVRKDKNNDKVFQIFTPSRTYRLQLEGEDDTARYAVSAWVASLKGACENAQQQNHSGMNAARGSFSNYKVDEVDQALMKASQYKHPAKRLIDAETMYTSARKGPHSPAALHEYEDWTPFDVSAWLYTVHMQKYSEEFYKNQIDGKSLKKITGEVEAKNLGVEDEDIASFMAAIQTLKDMNLINDIPLA